MSKYTQMSMNTAREEGWTVGVVERWIERAKKRIDLFGIIDVVAIKPSMGERDNRLAGYVGGTLGIQSCPGSGHAEHRAKALAEPRLRTWLEADNRFEIWSWAKRRTQELKKDGTRGKRKIYTLR